MTQPLDLVSDVAGLVLPGDICVRTSVSDIFFDNFLDFFFCDLGKPVVKCSYCIYKKIC
jgi:hypothetical protein